MTSCLSHPSSRRSPHTCASARVCTPLPRITLMPPPSAPFPLLQEYLKLEFLREIGFCHLRISEGVDSRLQLAGLLAKMCNFIK